MRHSHIWTLARSQAIPNAPPNSDQYWLQQGTKPNPLTLGDKTD